MSRDDQNSSENTFFKYNYLECYHYYFFLDFWNFRNSLKNIF